MSTEQSFTMDVQSNNSPIILDGEFINIPTIIECESVNDTLMDAEPINKVTETQVISMAIQQPKNTIPSTLNCEAGTKLLLKKIYILSTSVVLIE